MSNISEMREEYLKGGLNRKDLNVDPFKQFELWFAQAEETELRAPNAMSLSTTGADGMPDSRTVLLKLYDERGFVFFTNYGSEKARQLNENPKAALLFPWLGLERQVRIQGEVEKVSTQESLSYFMTRPRGSQIGAWSSAQSSPISSRSLLTEEWQKLKRKFSEGEVPLPDFWGGYRVKPVKIEFWQGRANRLHDRFVYRKADDSWTIERLAP